MPQNKQNIKSEYSKSFKTYADEAQTEYSKNFKFRIARRNNEISHQPWAWLDIDVDEDAVSDVSVEENHENSEDIDSNFDASGCQQESGLEDDRVARLTERAMRRVKEMKGEIAPRPGGAEEAVRRPQHPRRRPARPPPPTARTSPAAQHPINLNNHSQSLAPRPAFIAYGIGSPARLDGHKATFNIRAGTDVHPSASRALQHRQTWRQQQQEAARRPSRRSAGPTAPPDGSSIRKEDCSDWLSEYRRGYPGYNDEVYRRCLANVAPRGQSARLAPACRTCRI